MNVHRTASPKTARTTSTTLLRTMRLVNVGTLSSCERRRLSAVPTRVSGRRWPRQYRCWAEDRTNALSGTSPITHTSRVTLDRDPALQDRCGPPAAQLDRHATSLTRRRLEERLDPLRRWRRIADRQPQHATPKCRRGRVVPVERAVDRPPAPSRPPPARRAARRHRRPAWRMRRCAPRRPAGAARATEAARRAPGCADVPDRRSRGPAGSRCRPRRGAPAVSARRSARSGRTIRPRRAGMPRAPARPLPRRRLSRTVSAASSAVCAVAIRASPAATSSRNR